MNQTPTLHRPSEAGQWRRMHPRFNPATIPTIPPDCGRTPVKHILILVSISFHTALLMYDCFKVTDLQQFFFRVNSRQHFRGTANKSVKRKNDHPGKPPKVLADFFPFRSLSLRRLLAFEALFILAFLRLNGKIDHHKHNLSIRYARASGVEIGGTFSAIFCSAESGLAIRDGLGVTRDTCAGSRRVK